MKRIFRLSSKYFGGLVLILLVLGIFLVSESWAPTTEPFLEGWMTGGGSFFYLPTLLYGGQVGSRVTHGFVVHCTPRNSDNLEIVDHSTGLNFHLTDLTYAVCSDDPGIEPNPPDAAFDTFYGEGVGRCKMPPSNQWQDCSIRFTFTDGGERGGCIRDTAAIEITNGFSSLIIVGSDVDCGNHQAHDGF